MPAWFDAAKKEIGVREIPENRGPAIRRYIKLAHVGSEGDPWCAIFVNAMLESSGVRGSRSAMARSFETSRNFQRIPEPTLGCIVTFWRGRKVLGLGHCGFYNGETGDYISTLGGNESDMVRVEMLRRNGNTFGFSGYWWPKSVPLPTLGRLVAQATSVPGSGKVT